MQTTEQIVLDVNVTNFIPRADIKITVSWIVRCEHLSRLKTLHHLRKVQAELFYTSVGDHLCISEKNNRVKFSLLVLKQNY